MACCFAAVRHLFGTPTDGQDFHRRLMSGLAAKGEAAMMERSTPDQRAGARATLLPVLARLPQLTGLDRVGRRPDTCVFYRPLRLRLRTRADCCRRGAAALIFPVSPTPRRYCRPPAAGCLACWPRSPLVDAIDLRSGHGSKAWSGPKRDRPPDASASCSGRRRRAMAPRIMAGDLAPILLPSLRKRRNGRLVIFHTAVLSLCCRSRSAMHLPKRRPGDWRDAGSPAEAPAVFPDIAARAGHHRADRPTSFCRSMARRPPGRIRMAQRSGWIGA